MSRSPGWRERALDSLTEAFKRDITMGRSMLRKVLADLEPAKGYFRERGYDSVIDATKQAVAGVTAPAPSHHDRRRGDRRARRGTSSGRRDNNRKRRTHPNRRHSFTRRDDDRVTVVEGRGRRSGAERRNTEGRRLGIVKDRRKT